MTTKARTIRVDVLARVEGEGALTMRLRGDVAEQVELRIFEPPRLFEAFLRGRAGLEAPDLTSRICGICPVAYMMSSCRAIEDALGVEVGAEVRALRRLLYCGEWIESHALHVFLLHAPDFLGYPDAVAMAKDHRELVQRGLRLKKTGNAIVTLLGGREIHPINVRVGGFYRAPTRRELERLRPEIVACQSLARDTIRELGALRFPDFERDYELVALKSPDEYAIDNGRLASSAGLDLDVRDWDATFVEEQVPYSTALHAHVRGRGAYVCGPLARVGLSFDRLHEPARESARAVGFVPPMRNPYRSILARAVEILHALCEAERILDAYVPPDPPAATAPARAGTGHGCTEAPRGALYHRYVLDDEGTITDARIVPPTSQNQPSIEDDLRGMAKALARLPLAEAKQEAERAIRNYDPCISCSTHYLDLRIERR